MLRRFLKPCMTSRSMCSAVSATSTSRSIGEIDVKIPEGETDLKSFVKVADQAADLETFFKLPEEGLPKAFSKTLEMIDGEKHWMLRRPTLRLLRSLCNPELRRPGYVLKGDSGTGKSVGLAQVVDYCRSNDWIVLHVPEARALGYKAPAVNESLIYPGQYDVEEFGTDLLKSFQSMNGEKLDQIPLGKDFSKDFFQPLELKFEGKSLADFVQFGIEQPDAACSVVVELIFELGRIESHQVLIAIDEFNWLYFDTVFGFQGKDLIANDLTIARALKPFTTTGFRRKSLKNGAFVCALTENYPTKFQTEDVIKASHSSSISYQAYSREELDKVMAYYKDVRFSFEPVTEESSAHMSFMTARNPHQVYQRLRLL